MDRAHAKQNQCSLGFETGRYSDKRLPSLAQYMELQSDTQGGTNSIRTWPKLQSIQREKRCEEFGQYDAEENDARIASRSEKTFKNSRYLREGDRRSILLRIDKGEKQSDLAKEYKVTRAAICYLKKHRNEVLTRTYANPLAQHPKKPRRQAGHGGTLSLNPSTARSQVDFHSEIAKNSALPPLAAVVLPRLPQKGPLSSRQHGPAQQPHQCKLEFVYEMKTRSTLLLLTKIEDITTSPAEFQRTINRLMHLLTEEALASVTVVPCEVFVSQNEHVSGHNITRPSCAISMMTADCPMLSILNQLEPEFTTAYAYVHHVDQSLSGITLSVELGTLNLPARLDGHNTLLINLVTGSGHELCAVIDVLLGRGAIMNLVTIVSLFASIDAIVMVHDQFPGVRFLAVQVNPPVDITSAWLRNPLRDHQLWQWVASLYQPGVFWSVPIFG